VSRSPQESERVVEMVLPATPLAPGQARAALRELPDELPPGVLDDVLLLVSEIVTNSVRHAAKGPDGRIHLRVRSSRTGVLVDVWDWGPGFAPDAVGVPRPNGDDGFGLYLVAQLSSRWGVEREGSTHVWLEIAKPPPRATPRRQLGGGRPDTPTPMP